MTSLYPLPTNLSPRELAYCVALSIVHVVVGSITFDLIHWKAHQSGRSSNPLFRWLARVHITHHQFFDRRLNFNQSYTTKNLIMNTPLELLSQAFGTLVSWQFLRILAPRPDQLTNQDISLALTFLTIRSAVVAYNEGRDSNHVQYSRLPKDPHSVIVGPQYHALHHIDPQGYFGSMIRLVDWIFGTATTLHGRTITITGSHGALGQALLQELGQEKGTRINELHFGSDWNYDDYSQLKAMLQSTDILILAHGARLNNAFTANCESAIAIINAFMEARDQSNSLLRPEIWYIGSEAELHGAWTEDMREYTESKRAFARFARAYYEDEYFLYRHIVPAAFSSPMGSALVSARWTARVIMWWVRRGARYVPATYTGLAFLNFFRFWLWVKPAILVDSRVEKG